MSHDGGFHAVTRVIRRRYAGVMVGLRHAESEQRLWVTADHLVLTRRAHRSMANRGHWAKIPGRQFERARELRREMTVPERILWKRLRSNGVGVKFRRQHPVGPYIADFYARDAALVVEVDGAYGHSGTEAAAHDAARDAYMEAQGLRVLRFTAQDVSLRTSEVARAIHEACQESALPEAPEWQWTRAERLEVGDVVCWGGGLSDAVIDSIETETSVEEVYDIEVEQAHSFLTEVCMVHNCGSGTTAYVAEQWGRRWITIDTSRVALALARARIMGARYPYYLLADSNEGQAKEAALTRSLPSEQPTYGNIRHGFVYERVPHITLKSIANNAEIDVIWERFEEELAPLRSQLSAASGREKTLEEWEIPREAPEDWPPATHSLLTAFWEARIARQQEIDASIAAKADYEFLYDKPYADNAKVRVAGPFTVESLSPHRVLGVDEDDELIDTAAETQGSYGQPQDFATMILENLRTAGVQQAHKEDRITFTALEPWPGDGLICAEGRYMEGANEDGEGGTERRAGILIGPEFGTVSRPDLVEAAREAGDAGFDVLIACAFNYEAHASEFNKLGKIPVLKARMNADLHMSEDLKNTGKGNLFVIFGEPDIEIHHVDDGQIQVEVKGVDIFKPSTGEIVSGGPDDIACWFIDTDYNAESFFVRHAYFLGQNDPYKSLKTTLKAEINEEAWETLHSATSRPFDPPESGRIAVKVINHLGDEVMKVFRVEKHAG